MFIKFLDTNGDYYLRKGMELERQREKLIEIYNRSRNPKILDQIKLLHKECNAMWTTVKLRGYLKYIK